MGRRRQPTAERRQLPWLADGTAGRLIVLALCVGYAGAWAVSALVTTGGPSDLDLYFWPSAEIAAHGHVLQVYAGGGSMRYPNANGPVGLLPLVPIALVVNAVGRANDLRLRAGLSDAASAVFILFMAQQAMRLIRLGRVQGAVHGAALSVFLFAPALWISIADFGHFEQPIEIGLVLLSIRLGLSRRPVRSGFALGLAVLSRTTAVLYALPSVLAPLATRRLGPAARTVVTATATAAAGVTPFVAVDPGDVLHSLITYRADLPVGGGSIWLLAFHTSWSGLVEHADGLVILIVATGLSVLVIVRRPQTVVTVSGLCGLLALEAACFPMLAKTVYPYYLLEPYVFASVWWLAHDGAVLSWRIVVPLLITGDAFLAEWAVRLPLTGVGLVEGITSTAVLAVVVTLVAWDLITARSKLGADGTEVSPGFA